MPSDIVKHLGPDERELLEALVQLSALQSELAELELARATLLEDVNRFDRLFWSVLAARYAELDSLQAQIATEEARIADEAAALDPESSYARAHASEARCRAEQAHRRAQDSAAEAQSQNDVPPPEPFVPSADLKALFRKVARAVHPDLAPDETSREHRTELMAAANEAYACGDAQRLQTILDSADRLGHCESCGVRADLERTRAAIARVQARIRDVLHEIDVIECSHLFELMTRSERLEDEGRSLLSEMATELDSEIERARQRLQKLNRSRQDA